MPAQRRRFSIEEKLNILQKAKQLGVTKVLRDNNLSYSVFAKWKEKFPSIHSTGNSMGTDYNELKNLVEENKRLKKIIAEQALELEIKSEQLQKIRDKQS